MTAQRLTAEECSVTVSDDALRFESTEDVAPLSGILAQERAVQALNFGLDIQQPRFHVVVVGAPGTGRTFVARSVARRIAKGRPTPDDIVLLPNPRRVTEPKVLSLPAGEGRPFIVTMEELHAHLVQAVRGVADGERFKQARAKVRRRVTGEEARLEEELKLAASRLGLVITRAESEMQIAPENEEAPPGPEAMQTIATNVEEFESRLTDVHEDADLELRNLMKQLLTDAVHACFDAARDRFGERPDVGRFLGDVEEVVCRDLRLSVDEPRGEDGPPPVSRGLIVPTLLTEHQPGAGAPVVEVPYPTLGALFGRTHAPSDPKFPPEPGFAVAGAIHEANGGFLILPAATLLKNESLYEQLKACLLAGKFIVPEHNPTYYRGAAEELLFPPLPLDLKVVLVASPSLFQELHEADPEFSQLFKVLARFESTLSYGESLVTYPSFLSGISHDKKLPALTSAAVRELVVHGCRLAESQTKVSAQLGLIAEIATEAGYRARRAGRAQIDGSDVRETLDAQRRRGGYFRDELHDLLARNIIQVDVVGRRVGQVNAISVITDGPLSFGRPCRVTATCTPGFEGPIDIAREVSMSGPIHQKGVHTLAGFMMQRFGRKRPVTFAASVVFEQTYEPIDGDSASTAELLAILSSLSRVALRQDLAVTGAVDQLGAVQAVGGINDKIEAFYDVCCAKGMTGEQGVIVPDSTRDGLLLRRDVVEAIRARRFHVHAASRVEDALELMTGRPVGHDDHGAFPAGSIYALVEECLTDYHRILVETLRR